MNAAVIRAEASGTTHRPIDAGQVWTVDGESGEWFVLAPGRVIALFAGGADHTPASLIHTYGDRLRLKQTATVYADRLRIDALFGEVCWCGGRLLDAAGGDGLACERNPQHAPLEGDRQWRPA